MFKIGIYNRPLYTCPMCRQTFEDFDSASSCTTSHIVPTVIDSFTDIDTDGPETIVVNLSNGTKGIYHLESIEKNETA